MVDLHKKSKLQQSFLSTNISFSFPKSNRFKVKAKEKSVDFYNIPSAFSKRSTSFGFGKRSELICQTNTPSPDSYNPKTKTKIGLAISRSGLDERLKPFSNTIPGPGTYSVFSFDSSPKYSIIPRPIAKKIETSPCACNYNPNFNYVLKSNYKGVGFGYGKKVVMSKNPEVPGPGAYKIPQLFPKISHNSVQLLQSHGLK
ncbi:hypothetical protein SteCoe_4010 [Stentor coeruleus]|uniref:Uncharacterized protein n=1 Tax=Stentor coeruleus TaxID=5963 RepID=A0A1R2BXQ8_9CILI|nr:hypothetical protein SteCoe_17932 [Stentor coeruleus]OMJ93070.1 hypothetical protein SteCoe_4010 [Stentor coeruleus]